MNPRRRRKSRQRYLTLARRRRLDQPADIPPPLPVRRPGTSAGRPVPTDLEEHQPDTSLLHRVRDRLASLP
ncbi:hypothetical protein [Streptomyces acidiscabies]|uniref:Uncharacterized protein n=1 Tax=Streptomyces acidiscabies TaxID=42234 RepID=A0AAP6EH75_9ACTN|nr:hypothetical protein [Streptomyces acidiscabies]MBP5941727.1 hypothetical protein [Streptomyces sp. LBUM 1476]MBZ3913142.1 hypothetical protein [Streptomyces acidiscabies]MDX2962837.1 hypothetical protein [Streptomyces acidiscabies]MDX3021348.1 hypothetical protein [Streptomyces acidiscabies]MDX3790106.1 hypothetical protein [Streptomyces acidiscabies]